MNSKKNSANNSANNSENNSANNSANVEHFNKFRALSVGELYYFLYTHFKDYIEYSSFVIYIKSQRSLHIPRSTFSKKRYFIYFWDDQ